MSNERADKDGKRNNDNKKKRASSVDTNLTQHKRSRVDHQSVNEITPTDHGKLPFDYKYVLAPMVGASELSFRLLCRKYGAQLAYTPMMSSTQFANSAKYRQEEFQTIPQDRPLVCHFSANSPADFAAAAKLCEPVCDAIDLNLGCPQRTAYVGHFGSYLLEKKDRQLVLDIVRAGAQAVKIPIFCKIRLLDTVADTIELCSQLANAGASLIAIHARYRASFERKGPGARDGPAMLDRVLEIKRALGEKVLVLANGNVITHEDVVNNLKFTQADGIMSAEGILDNPALFLPRFGSQDDIEVLVKIQNPLAEADSMSIKQKEKERKLLKKLKKIGRIETRMKSDGADSINEEQREKLATKTSLDKRLRKLKKKAEKRRQAKQGNDLSTVTVPLSALFKSADDPLALATEYLSLVRRYPTKIRTVIFHTRRMLKELLNRYQLMEECIACESVDDVETVIQKCIKYRSDPDAFIFDKTKAARQKEALEKKRREEGKRKAFEARMIRKAKREKRTDLEYYLRMGADVPTVEIIQQLGSLSRPQQLQLWKKNHSQHCMSYHLDPGGCKRDRACAFLHVDAKGNTTFLESEEVAG